MVFRGWIRKGWVLKGALLRLPFCSAVLKMDMLSRSSSSGESKHGMRKVERTSHEEWDEPEASNVLGVLGGRGVETS